MGYRPPPMVPRKQRPPTALEHVKEQYARGERDIEGLERGVEWLLRHRLEDTHEFPAARWPPEVIPE